jgi:alpha-beta hydrolase superfamily lysophospholipase
MVTMQHDEFTIETADNLTLFGQGWTPDQAVHGVVCLVHGLGEHSSRYRHVADFLTQSGYVLLTFDKRGHGRSDGQRGHAPNYEVLLDDIEQLLEEARHRYPQTPHFLYGHSMGGNLVINYVLRRRPQLAGVIATSPWLRLAVEPSRGRLFLAQVMDVLAPSLSLPSGLQAEAISRDPDEVEAYRNDPLVHDRVTSRLGMSLIESAQWALEHAEDFPLPLLITHGSEDRLTSAEASAEFAERADDCTFMLWENLRHETHNEPEKEEVLALLVGWLEEHTHLPG